MDSSEILVQEHGKYLIFVLNKYHTINLINISECRAISI